MPTALTWDMTLNGVPLSWDSAGPLAWDGVAPTMPYDPTLPLPNPPLESQVIRDQFQALFNLINNIATLTAAQVDGVTTVNLGDPANVSVSVSGGTLHLSFSIPRGADGATGDTGQNGEVTQVDLNNALQNTLSQTSNVTNNVNTLDTPFTNDPPTTADMEMMGQAYNDLVLALRRTFQPAALPPLANWRSRIREPWRSVQERR